MQIVIVFALCAVTVMGAPSTLPALQHEEVHDEMGQYVLRYVTAEGTVVYERGHLVHTADGTDVVMIQEGEYSYIGTDGKTYTTKYNTDPVGGYHVNGEHLPKATEVIVEPVLL